MNPLDKIFGNATRVKLLKLFLFNPEQAFSSKDVVRKTRSTAAMVRKELAILLSAGFLKKRTGTPVEAKKSHSRKKTKRASGSRDTLWRFNPAFSYQHSLSDLLSGEEAVDRQKITRLISKTGNVKLIVLSGIFTKNQEGQVDLLIAGDSVRQRAFQSAVASIEAEMGRELRYALFGTKDFMYRLSMYDKLVRDVLDYPHQKMLNRIGL